MIEDGTVHACGCVCGGWSCLVVVCVVVGLALCCH